LYTTETYIKKNWYKIGESIKNPIKRIQSQDNASNPEPLIMVAHWNVPDNINDKKIHKELNNLGFLRLRNSREWFELSKNPKKDIEDILKSFDSLIEHIEFNFEIPVFDYKELWWFKKTNPPI
jgi:hypothetical protein